MRKVYEQYINWNNTRITEKIYIGGVEIKRIRSRNWWGVVSTELRRSTLHVMDDTRRIATVHNWSKDDNLLEINSGSELNTNKIRYQYGNHLDSASLELSSTGQIISYEEYFPYGDTSFMAGTSQKEVKLKEYRYTGKEKDDSTGLYYFGARYYASWLGRWMSADPLFRENPGVYERPKGEDEEEQKKLDEEYLQKLFTEGLNLYRYVKGNPVRFVDPAGMWDIKADDVDKKGRITIISEKDDTIEEIARQLNVDPEMISKYNHNINKNEKLQAGIEIDLTEVFKNDKRSNYKNLYKAVQIQHDFYVKNTAGTKDIPCALVAWGFSTGKDIFSYKDAFKVFGKKVWETNQPFEDYIRKNYISIKLNESRIWDIITFGPQQPWGGSWHYAVKILSNRKGEIWTFSKVGTNGPFRFVKASVFAKKSGSQRIYRSEINK